MSEALAAALFEEHRSALLRYLGKVTGDSALAEDLAQDVFVRVLRGGGRYEERGKPRAWLFTIARRLLADKERSESRKPPPESLEKRSEPAGIPAQDLRTGLDQALRMLPATERDAFLLRELGGLSYAEIATVIGVSEPAVRSLLYRARQSLREKLALPLGRARKEPRRRTS